MDYQTIRYDQAGGVVVITMNRPAVMNSLNSQMRAELAAALTRAGTEARCVVLTGEGRAFCAGQDLSDGSVGPNVSELLRKEYDPVVKAITGCPVPVIAAVNGIAAGAGASIALTCDVVIAAESASFLQAFSKIGLIPDAGGTWVLPRLVGQARAMGMALFADRITARQAESWGMIWEALPDAEFAAGWRARAETLANGPTQAHGRLKKLLQASVHNSHDDQLALEAVMQGECAVTEDFCSAVQAFLTKQPATFTGR